MPETKKTERKPRAKAPEGETKEAKFRRLAPPRVNRALRSLESVAKLKAYKPREEDVKAIVNSLSSKLSDVQNRLKGISVGGFALPE